MTLSQVALTVAESPTLKLNETAARLAQKGEPVIHLGGGEPKSKAPLDAIVAASGIMGSGEVRYTPPDGIAPLKQAIIRYTEQFYGRVVGPENVMASSGAKQAIMVALHAVLNPQDELIYPSPFWVSYPEMCKLVGAVGVPVPAEDGGFQPTLAEIEERITSYTKAIIINSPNNPSGAVYSEELIAGVVELCEKRDLWLILDDIYHRLIFDGRQPISAWKYAKEHGENSKLIIINGVSKMYAMTGFRIGWAVGNKALIRAMTNIQSQQTSGPSAVLQHAAVGALNGVQSGVEALRMTLENNRKIMVERLNTIDGVRLIPPGGTFYAFPNFSAFEKSSVKLAQLLLERVKVVTVPGREFGMEGHLRLSTCGSVKDIREGVERIKWALDPNAPNELMLGDRRLVRDWL